MKPGRRTGGQADRKAAERKNPPEHLGGFSSSESSAGPPARRSAQFVGTFPDPAVRLEPPLPEIAFIGRSNVGKSSLINALLGQPGMARVSATPGKTRALNVFRLPDFFLVDLPGYGYARADKATRAAIHRIVDRYIRDRKTLAGVVWLLDIRRDLSPEDVSMGQLLAETGRPVLAGLTKADKLVHSARLQRGRALGDALGLDPGQVQVISSTTGLGIADLSASVVRLGQTAGSEREETGE